MRRVPPLSHAWTLARQVRLAALGPGRVNAPLSDLDEILRLGGCEARETELSAREGMQEAMLIPLPRNRFAISVDPTPPGGWAQVRPALRESLRRHRLRFRVAHEIAHTIFYARAGGEPRRVVRDSPAQEAFCDEFARALLVPPPAAATTPLAPEAVHALQRRFDVSLEVAARSVAAAHGPSAIVVLWYRPHDENAVRVQWSSPAVDGGLLPQAPTPHGLTSSRKDVLWDRLRDQWIMVASQLSGSHGITRIATDPA